MSGGNEPTPVVNRPVRVLAVDDHPPFRALLHDLVGATRELELVGEAESGERAVELAWELKPDMILMDVRMPGLGGIEAARRIKMSIPATLIVLISTTHPDELRPDLDCDLAGAVLWKCELQPKRLDEIWRSHGHPLPPSLQTVASVRKPGDRG
jgi:DNA-binding NarL/FixJ family response regulator